MKLTGAELIAQERERQVAEEGFTEEHDSDAYHKDGQLALAAMCYLIDLRGSDLGKKLWPWGLQWWKPTLDPVRQLTKAGALIAAEIDRLQRQEQKHE